VGLYCIVQLEFLYSRLKLCLKSENKELIWPFKRLVTRFFGNKWFPFWLELVLGHFLQHNLGKLHSTVWPNKRWTLNRSLWKCDCVCCFYTYWRFRNCSRLEHVCFLTVCLSAVFMWGKDTISNITDLFTAFSDISDVLVGC